MILLCLSNLVCMDVCPSIVILYPIGVHLSNGGIDMRPKLHDDCIMLETEMHNMVVDEDQVVNKEYESRIIEFYTPDE